ncbi:hypothetical protein L1987_63374 [Smallanthus sonchifolius]|uniref:Uncharacterized protein n=1 Tax=Smallanthus sonchifolius TaxID=185202 RepID=A0ACB9CD46_9ASTR|nr:hypothetical protein L1987_63374 [Smallanthus sonchifolius]
MSVIVRNAENELILPCKGADSSKSNETVFSHKLKNMALRVIGESLSEEELAAYSAQITFEELKAGLKGVGANSKES